MTLLEIDLKDVVGEVHPSDHVRVWAPAHREGPDGETVNTRPVKIPLVNGVGEQEVVPGPLVIEIVAHDSRQDTRAKQVDIPDQASITLAEALTDAFVWEPEVVSRVSADAAAAKRASDEAEAAAADAGLSATAAATSETNAAGHATQTSDDRRQTGEDRQAAAQSATDAATSATTAEGHKATVQTALAGARLYSGTGFPNGVVTAPVGSIYTDTAATNGAVRWIKTSGTGNTGWTVEYGDTGWRDVSQTHLGDGWALRNTNDRLVVRRHNGFIHVAVRIAVGEGAPFLTHDRSDRQVFLKTLPIGFGQPHAYAFADSYRHNVTFVGLLTNGGVNRGLDASCQSMGGNWGVGDEVTGTTSWTTPDTWPTTLPGIPS